MLNLEEINEAIYQLENGSTTYDTCSKLASLYIVKDKLINPLPSMVDRVETELNDILPQYKMYCTVKRKYQLNELTEKAVYLAMQDVCTEIKEFIQTLYSGTDTQEERNMIKELIYNLQEAL